MCPRVGYDETLKAKRLVKVSRNGVAPNQSQDGRSGIRRNDSAVACTYQAMNLVAIYEIA